MGKNNNRNYAINFKVTEQEKKIIEDHAYAKRLGVSEYVRQSVFFDLMMSGNVEAIKYVASNAKGNIFKYLIAILKIIRKDNCVKIKVFWQRFKDFMTRPSMTSFGANHYLPLWKSVFADWACLFSFGLFKPK
jgi:hypothetical protein